MSDAAANASPGPTGGKQVLTVRTTSSVVEPQEALVTVNRKVTVPKPLTLTEVVGLVGLTMLAEADPVEPTTLHCEVPPVAEPLTVTTVGLLVRQVVLSAPAFASGASVNAMLVVLLALHPPGALTETDKVVEPLPPAVQVIVRVFCPLVIVPLLIVQLYPAL